MRRYSLGLAAIMAAGCMPMMAAAPGIDSLNEAIMLVPSDRRRRAISVNNGKLRRSKGKDQRRKLKSNRLHISRRVRRKHRRAR